MKKIFPILLVMLVMLAACQSDKKEEKASEKGAAASLQSGEAAQSPKMGGTPAQAGKAGDHDAIRIPGSTFCSAICPP